MTEPQAAKQQMWEHHSIYTNEKAPWDVINDNSRRWRIHEDDAKEAREYLNALETQLTAAQADAGALQERVTALETALRDAYEWLDNIATARSRQGNQDLVSNMPSSGNGLNSIREALLGEQP